MTDIFEEVNETVRQEALAKWWKRLLPFIIAAVVLVIGAVAIYEFLSAQRRNEIERNARAFDAGMLAIEREDLSAARDAFAQLGQGEGGFALIANHLLAGVEKDSGGETAAIAEHFKAAAERGDGLMADLAVIKQGYAIADAATLADVEDLMKPLIDKGGPAGALARELVAAKALASGDVERARTEYQALSLQLEAPGGMQARVQQTLATLPPRQAATDAPATSADAPADGQPAPSAQPAPAQPAPQQQ